MIHIGNQTAFSAARLMEPFEFALAHGFTAFEWFPDRNASGAGWDDVDLDAAVRASIRKVSRERGLRLSVHARWQANPLLGGSWPLLKRDAELAVDIGAALLNIHLQTEEGIPAYINAIQPLVTWTGEHGLQLAIENTVHTGPGDFNALFDHLQRGGARHVCMCLDVGHANLCAATRNDYLGFLDRLDGHVPVGHLHLHENWGDRDSHLTIFTGPSAECDKGVRGVIERLKQRGFSGSVILEQWPQPPGLLVQAHQRLAVLMSDAGLAVAEGNASVQTGLNSSSDHSSVVCETTNSQSERTPGIPPQELQLSGDSTGGLACSLIAGHETHGSWRKRLATIAELLAGLDPSTDSTTALVDVAVYLRFLGTGQLSCTEDGGHFRPSHHARASIEIQNHLATLGTADNRFIIRKILPWLPSGDAMFTRAEPLTRIRDIAHRNDIPSDLKREIKSTLQNKLHRCAGPEDLETSRALLGRITAPGAHYAAEFVEQFKVFHAELESFFNARPLRQRLQVMAESAQPALKRHILAYLGQGSDDSRDLEAAIRCLGALTQLRENLLSAVQSAPGAATQEAMIADIGLEGDAFARFSEAASRLASSPQDLCIKLSAELLQLAVLNIRLSGIEERECLAVEAELAAWMADFDEASDDHCIRLKATVDRCRRLGDSYSDLVFSLFSGRTTLLGRSLGVDERAIQSTCEGDIRSHLVFQLSKLATLLIKRLRARLGAAPWDVLAGGCVRGIVTIADRLDVTDAVPRHHSGIVLLRSVSGDEDLPQGVKGLLVGHDLPHLSHLAVRARQAGVVLVACEETGAFESLMPMAGRLCILDTGVIAQEGRVLQPASEEVLPPGLETSPTATRDHAAPFTRRHVCEVSGNTPDDALRVLQLGEATLESCGGKAMGARRLEDLASGSTSGFRTPRSVVVPYAVLEQTLAECPEVARCFEASPDALESNQTPAAETLQTLRKSISELPIPPALMEEVLRSFPRNNSLMVRSSARGEDADTDAGAGLYDSVPVGQPEELSQAMRHVWASLWTQRAVSRRAQSGLPSSFARMALLIQELIPADYSFILHTAHPVTSAPHVVRVEIAPGLGEVLASASVRGTPWRVDVSVDPLASTVTAFASFSRALMTGNIGPPKWMTMDYSQQKLSRDPSLLHRMATRLAIIGKQVEAAFGRPQDIEGAVVSDDIYLVQSRAQQGLQYPLQP